MSILLPRARLNLSSEDWGFLELAETERKHFQALLDNSNLETRLQQQFGEKVYPLTATDIVPSAYTRHLINSTQVLEADIVIIVSKHAALLARLLIAQSVFRNAHCYAVGKASCVFFEELDISIQTASDESAQGLLALPALQDMQDKKVMLIKGEQGLNLLEQACKQGGAELEILNLYERQAAKANVELESEIDLVEVSFIYGVSVFALRHLLEASCDEQYRQALKAIPLLAMSDRIAQTATRLGFTQVSVKPV